MALVSDAMKGTKKNNMLSHSSRASLNKLRSKANYLHIKLVGLLMIEDKLKRGSYLNR